MCREIWVVSWIRGSCIRVGPSTTSGRSGKFPTERSPTIVKLPLSNEPSAMREESVRGPWRKRAWRCGKRPRPLARARCGESEMGRGAMSRRVSASRPRHFMCRSRSCLSPQRRNRRHIRCLSCAIGRRSIDSPPSTRCWRSCLRNCARSSRRPEVREGPLRRIRSCRSPPHTHTCRSRCRGFATVHHNTGTPPNRRGPSRFRRSCGCSSRRMTAAAGAGAARWSSRRARSRRCRPTD